MTPDSQLHNVNGSGPYLQNGSPSPSESNVSGSRDNNVVASAFAQATDFTFSGNMNNIGHQETHNVYYNHTPSGAGLGILQQHVADDAFHDSSARDTPPRCHPGTRERVCTMIKDWIDDTAATSRILWLYGSAGVGKSAIAQTMAEHCHGAGKLAATFFFSRASSNRNNANQLFTTLAWQLAMSIPETRPYIDEALILDPLLPKRAIKQQFDILVLNPLRRVDNTDVSMSKMKRIIIIDGVDECTGEETQRRFLKLLEDAVLNEQIPLRLLICSRPEPQIRGILGHSSDIDTPTCYPTFEFRNTRQGRRTFRMFLILRYLRHPFMMGRTLLDAGGHTVLAEWRREGIRNSCREIRDLYQSLQRVRVDQSELESSDQVDEMISDGVISRIAIGHSSDSENGVKNYLQDEFAAIASSSENELHPDLWPSPEVIGRLVKTSCGQFLYASVIVRYIKDEQFHPDDALGIVMNSRQSHSTPFQALDCIYTEVLQQQSDQGFLADLFAILIVFSEDIHVANIRQNVPVINGLLGLKDTEISCKLRGMHSLLKISANSIGVHHRSFLEYLLDPSRSRQYHITHRKALTRFCWLLMRAVGRYSLRRAK